MTTTKSLLALCGALIISGCAQSPATPAYFGQAPDPDAASGEADTVHPSAEAQSEDLDPGLTPPVEESEPQQAGAPAFEPQDLTVWSGEAQVQAVGFSSDGRIFAYVLMTGSMQGTLHLLDTVTQDTRVVDTHVVWGTGTDAVSMSADGRRVAYRRSHDEQTLPDFTFQSALWTWGWDDAAPQAIDPDGLRSGFQVTRNGKYVVYVNASKAMWRYAVADGQATQLAPVAFTSVYGDAKSAFPISDDSRYVAIVAGFKYGPQHVVDLETLAMMDVDDDAWVGRARWIPGTHELVYPRRLDYETGQWATWTVEGGPQIEGGEAAMHSGWSGYWQIELDHSPLPTRSGPIEVPT